VFREIVQKIIDPERFFYVFGQTLKLDVDPAFVFPMNSKNMNYLMKFPMKIQ